MKQRYQISIQFDDGTSREFEAHDVKLDGILFTWKETPETWHWGRLRLNEIVDLHIENIELKDSLNDNIQEHKSIQ